MNPSQGQSQEQIPLFLDNKKEVENLAKELSLEDKTISGANYGRLYNFGHERGLSNVDIDNILSQLGIKIDSKLPPEEPRPNIQIH